MPPPTTRLAPAFTLVELLVSMTILVIIVVLTASLISSTTSITVGNRKRLDADAQARVVFDRMAQDFAKMLKRTDVDYLFAKIDGTSSGSGNNGGNDAMFFYSEAPAFYDGDATSPAPESSVALLGYRINNAFQLERLGKLLTWDGIPSSPSPGGIMFLSQGVSATPNPLSTLQYNWPTTIGAPTDSPPYSSGTDQDYHVLAQQVCRFEFCYQLTNGTYSTLPICPLSLPSPLVSYFPTTRPPAATDDTTQHYAPGSRWYDSTGGRSYVCISSAQNAAVWNFLGLQDVNAIVVALAILDAASDTIVPKTQVTVNGQSLQAPNLSGLVTAFADASISATGSSKLWIPNVPTPAPAPTASPTAARLMAEAWFNEMQASSSPAPVPSFVTASGLPAAAAAQVRVYQRSFPLNTQE